MINIGTLSADEYGIMIFSTEKFNEYIKSKKWNAKKYLSWFDKNKDCFYQIIKDGIIVPIYRISSFKYKIFVKINENNKKIPDGYNEKYRFSDFFIEVGNNNKLCIASFGFFEGNIDLIKKDITEKSYTTLDGIKINSALNLDIEKGIYNYNLVGLELKEKVELGNENYGFLFEFYKNENALNDNYNKADNDKYTFSIDKYK